MGTTIVANAAGVHAAPFAARAGLVARDANTDTPCPRFAPGSVVRDPVSIFSNEGYLPLDLSYQYGVDSNGFSKFCFVDGSNNVGPLLRANPGDSLVINLQNQLPSASETNATGLAPFMAMNTTGQCGDKTIDASSVNVHWHGLTVSPTCHADDVIHTVINSGENFTYAFQIPQDASPGLYWYHPHIHGISEMAVQGGGSGPFIVEGLNNVQPDVAGLPERVFVLRDVLRAPDNTTQGAAKLKSRDDDDGGDGDGDSGLTSVPSWDVSINNVPVIYPDNVPAIIEMKPNERQLWRVVNSGADIIFNLQTVYDGQAQNLEVVALDGYATRLGDTAATFNQTEILIPSAGRAEFIVTGPGASVQNAQLVTLAVDTGPDGDSDPARPIANIRVAPDAPAPNHTLPAAPAKPLALGSLGLAKEHPSQTRTLVFSEDDTNFYLTVEGQEVQPFSMDNPPAINTTQGSIEDWVVINQSGENHEFHQHQIHFTLIERNNKTVPQSAQQLVDTVNIPGWDNTTTYPSVKLRMDFRGQDVGQYVYHCHILEHEDGGMMGTIQVNPASSSGTRRVTARGALTGVGVGTAVALGAAWLL